MSRNYFGDKRGRGSYQSIKGLVATVPRRTAAERIMRRHDRNCDNFEWSDQSMHCENCGFTAEMGHASKSTFKRLVVHKHPSTGNRRRLSHGRAPGAARNRL